ncbi:MAG: hypothetical protein V5783_10675 [Pontiella sp.]
MINSVPWMVREAAGALFKLFVPLSVLRLAEGVVVPPAAVWSNSESGPRESGGASYLSLSGCRFCGIDFGLSPSE